MRYSFEAMDRCIGRHRMAVAKALHKSPALVSKWMEPAADFTDSGTLNPLDRLETIITAAIHEGHPKDEATAPIVYLAGKFGLTVVSLPEAPTTLKDILTESHRAIKEFGHYIEAFSEAIEDGKVSPLERMHVEVEGYQAVQHILAVIRMLGEEK